MIKLKDVLQILPYNSDAQVLHNMIILYDVMSIKKLRNIINDEKNYEVDFLESYADVYLIYVR